MIASVNAGSAADEAGLRARDVIIEVNRAAVKNVDRVPDVRSRHSAKGKSVAAADSARRSDRLCAVKPEA